MENIENFEEDGVALGLGAAEIRSVARRQLVGSTVAAVLIVVVATLTALRPAYRETADIAPHKLAGIQRPSFVMPQGAHVADLTRRDIELP
jgi:hypothetical protein